MNLDEQRHRYRALDDWFKTPEGHYLGQAFHMQLTRHDAFLRGENLLQLGSCGDNVWLKSLLFHHKYNLTPCLDAPRVNCIASPETLPFHRNSMDTVIAPLMCELFGRDHHLFDEIDRVLKPMGHIIFLGINPLSFWGIALRCHRLPYLGHLSVTLTSSLTLKRAFSMRGYQQKVVENFYYVPPLHREHWIKKSLFLNTMGKLAAPYPAGFYCLIMQKYQPSSLPLEQTLRERFLLPG